jgi:hypothetical protein
MVVVPQISQRELYIIIGIIALIGLIFALIQIRRIRNAGKKVNYLKGEVELKKIDLVKRDLESVCKKNNVKSRNHKNMSSVQFGNPSEFRRMLKIDDITKTLEYQKVQYKLMDVDRKEDLIESRKGKFEMDDQDFKKKISKFDREC